MGKKFLGALNSHLSVNIFLVREPIATHLQLKNTSKSCAAARRARAVTR
jgi:hypothetical protein